MGVVVPKTEVGFFDILVGDYIVDKTTALLKKIRSENQCVLAEYGQKYIDEQTLRFNGPEARRRRKLFYIFTLGVGLFFKAIVVFFHRLRGNPIAAKVLGPLLAEMAAGTNGGGKTSFLAHQNEKNSNAVGSAIGKEGGETAAESSVPADEAEFENEITDAMDPHGDPLTGTSHSSTAPLSPPPPTPSPPTPLATVQSTTAPAASSALPATPPTLAQQSSTVQPQIPPSPAAPTAPVSPSATPEPLQAVREFFQDVGTKLRNFFS